MTPTIAMVLAAGLGTRMRPLTLATAKPLLPIGGRPLLDHALDRLASAGVSLAVVNTHWQAERIAAHVAARAAPPRIVIRHEETLLDTGGAVRAARDLLGTDPFYVVNGDSLWLDGPGQALLRLAATFAPAEVDGVLLLHRTFQVHADVGFGDFALDPLGTLRRRGEQEIVPYVYAGVQLIKPSLLDGMPEGPFSMNLAWDRALDAGRLRGVVHDGLWFHLSAPSDLADAEHDLHMRATIDTR
jgi:MurNAc alpha-1-phosphate uridylyltransferase